jgi:hypothetical protein
MRLGGPSEPTVGRFLGFLVGFSGFTIWLFNGPARQSFGAVIDVNVFGFWWVLLWCMAIALILGLICMGVLRDALDQIFVGGRQRLWAKNILLLRSARYCFRDGVIYRGETAKSPEDFIAAIWK